MITHRWHRSKLKLTLGLCEIYAVKYVATGTVIYFIRERNTLNFWEWFVSNPIFCQIATIASNLSKERALANPVMLYTKSNPSWWIKLIFSPNFFFQFKMITSFMILFLSLPTFFVSHWYQGDVISFFSPIYWSFVS